MYKVGFTKLHNNVTYINIRIVLNKANAAVQLLKQTLSLVVKYFLVINHNF